MSSRLSNPRLERTGARPARFARTAVDAGRSTAGRSADKRGVNRDLVLGATQR